MNRSNKYEINTNNFNVTKDSILIIRSTQNIYLLQSYLNNKKQVNTNQKYNEKSGNDIMRFLHVLDS